MAGDGSAGGSIGEGMAMTLKLPGGILRLD